MTFNFSKTKFKKNQLCNRQLKWSLSIAFDLCSSLSFSKYMWTTHSKKHLFPDDKKRINSRCHYVWIVQISIFLFLSWNMAKYQIFGYLAIWQGAPNMAKWGIPEKYIKNAAQKRWPQVRMTLHSKVMAKTGFGEFPPCISFEYRKSARKRSFFKIKIWKLFGLSKHNDIWG